MKRQSLKTKKKLTLNKLEISKLNNLDTIKGGIDDGVGTASRVYICTSELVTNCDNNGTGNYQELGTCQ